MLNKILCFYSLFRKESGRNWLEVAEVSKIKSLAAGKDT